MNNQAKDIPDVDLLRAIVSALRNLLERLADPLANTVVAGVPQQPPANLRLTCPVCLGELGWYATHYHGPLTVSVTEKKILVRCTEVSA